MLKKSFASVCNSQVPFHSAQTIAWVPATASCTRGAHVNYLWCEPALYSFILILSSHWIFISLPSTIYPRDLPKRVCFFLWGFSHQVFLIRAYQLLKEKSAYILYMFSLLLLPRIHSWGLQKSHSNWMAACTSFERWYLSTTGVPFTAQFWLFWGPFFCIWLEKTLSIFSSYRQIQHKFKTSSYFACLIH